MPYAMGALSRYCSNPGKLHYKYRQRVVRYIDETLDVGLAFRRDTEDDIVDCSECRLCWG